MTGIAIFAEALSVGSAALKDAVPRLTAEPARTSQNE
jgi:hypothetical protein